MPLYREVRRWSQLRMMKAGTHYKVVGMVLKPVGRVPETSIVLIGRYGEPIGRAQFP
jgi:hypothetical protein